ncbi:hypothetical protein JTB14_034381 [Gonioctena quinquepunctata]|nr:hypothetical protein JTB14_034381 [Gonioctena quinquepunctata]
MISSFTSISGKTRNLSQNNMGLSDDDEKNPVPAKRAKTNEIVDEVTKEPEQGLETLNPINPLERSECEQHGIHITNTAKCGSSHASFITGKRNKLEETLLSIG